LRPGKDARGVEKRVREVLAHLRICLKYQRFDLEATKRENRELRRMLEEWGRRDRK
jgi:hypothetical protein